jgi:phospholipid/cholesterol/gamma-HCH transport system permease protein
MSIDHKTGKGNKPNYPLLKIEKEEGGFCLFFSGEWTISHSKNLKLAEFDSFAGKLRKNTTCRFQLSDHFTWDSSFLLFLQYVEQSISSYGAIVDFSCLPEGMANLLAKNKTESFEQGRAKAKLEAGVSFFDQILFSFLRVAEFWGKWLMFLLGLIRGKSFARGRDFLLACRDCGASALPIVTLISYLTGLTMAFVGSVQLEKFNATIYTADLVCLAMVREMGPLMVAIVMAGRTGASFAAEIGSMKINEEVDSLRTLGIPAIDFLVLPRTMALFLMTPLLTLYADIVGIIGGLTVGTQVMGFSALHYFEQTQSALLSMWEIYSGLWKSLAFGLIVGLVGCYKGINSGSNSSSLGKAVTSSVVISITLIVIADALFELAYSYLGLR